MNEKTKYPDYDLIENLSRKYLAHSINALTKDETIDLINHLREAVRELKSNAPVIGGIPSAVWYCPTCKRNVQNEHVTFQETHDPRYGGCGGLLYDRNDQGEAQPPAKKNMNKPKDSTGGCCPPTPCSASCDGRCGQYGTCKGEVKPVTVKSGDGLRTWGRYNYCAAAIVEDERGGYIVLPNTNGGK